METDNQKKIRENIEYLKKIEKNLQLGRFRIDSTEELDFSLFTDHNGVFVFGSNGNSFFTTDGTSTEVVGRIIKSKGVPAKIIKAMNGDIVLDARDGDIILRGKNIKVFATDVEGGKIVMDSTKTVNINASITKVSADYCTIAATADLSTAAATSSGHAAISNENTTDAEENNGSFLSRILSAVKKFKKFFESPCG